MQFAHTAGVCSLAVHPDIPRGTQLGPTNLMVSPRGLTVLSTQGAHRLLQAVSTLVGILGTRHLWLEIIIFMLLLVSELNCWVIVLPSSLQRSFKKQLSWARGRKGPRGPRAPFSPSRLLRPWGPRFAEDLSSQRKEPTAQSPRPSSALLCWWFVHQDGASCLCLPLLCKSGHAAFSRF